MDNETYKMSVEATFDDVSHRYDENRFFAIAASKMAELLPTVDGLEILDLSTGTGAVAIAVAGKRPSASIEAIDLSLGMLERANTKARENGLTNIVFRQCDADKIAYADNRFDIVTCGYGLFFYPDIEETYRAICNVVKPGGMFIFSSFTEHAFNPQAGLFFKRLENDYNVEPPSRMRERLKTMEQIQELVASSEYSSLEVINVPIRYSIKVAEWWSLLNSAGFKSLLDKLDERQLQRFKEEHLDEVQILSDNGSMELNTDSLFGVVNL
jgi:ubiquinone/menaquinone biosynthesis C-methylase UbiE